MLTTKFDYIHPASETEREYPESLIRADYERCHPEDTLDYLKVRALRSPNDAGLLRDWMAFAAGLSADRAEVAHTVKSLDAADPRALPTPSPDAPGAHSGDDTVPSEMPANPLNNNDLKKGMNS
jgi:hypothetical protein